jgi:hypothetical protein
MIMTINPNLEAMLKLPIDPDDPEETILDYLHKLLKTLWEEGEGFNGKRPFGDSGWEYQLYEPLVRAGFVEGEIDEDGYVEDFNEDIANQLVFGLIDYIFEKEGR